MNNTLRLTALSAALLALAACGQTTVDASLSSRSGNLSVAMTDSSTAGAKAQSIEVTGRPPAGRVTSLILNLAGAQAVAGAGKPVTVTLSASLPDSDSDGNPDVDLIALAGGELTLTDSPLPAGTYRQFRLTTVRDGVYAVLEDGSKRPVAVPGGAQSGLKIVMKHGFTVGESTATSFTLDFDLARSLHATGNGKLVLKPVIRVKGTPAANWSPSRARCPAWHPASPSSRWRSSAESELTLTAQPQWVAVIGR